MIGENMGLFQDHCKMTVNCMKDTALKNLEYIKTTAPVPAPASTPQAGGAVNPTPVNNTIKPQHKQDVGIEPAAKSPNFCPNCGAPAGNGKFCSACGHCLVPADPKQALVQAGPQEADSHQQNVAAANRMFQMSQTQALSQQMHNMHSYNSY